MCSRGLSSMCARGEKRNKLSAAAAAKSLSLCPTLQPHRPQPTRLPCPWDSPGKNTGVGCHFLLQCMKVKSESEVVQSCLTLSDPMDCSLPGSSIHGIFQARVLEWGAIAFFTSFLVYLFIRPPSCQIRTPPLQPHCIVITFLRTPVSKSNHTGS